MVNYTVECTVRDWRTIGHKARLLLSISGWADCSQFEFSLPTLTHVNLNLTCCGTLKSATVRDFCPSVLCSTLVGGTVQRATTVRYHCNLRWTIITSHLVQNLIPAPQALTKSELASFLWSVSKSHLVSRFLHFKLALHALMVPNNGCGLEGGTCPAYAWVVTCC